MEEIGLGAVAAAKRKDVKDAKDKVGASPRGRCVSRARGLMKGLAGCV
jgi:hypothetical protein